jgi:aminoglycoside phosphotransferase (APT) family kinase protein
MIPQEKTAAVTEGLREAFGVTSFEDICMLTKGLSSALVFRIVVRGSPYLLRIITRTDAINDPTRQFACMKAAAEASIAPQVRYTSIPDRISITDFVEAVPFPITDALVRMAATLRSLHALEPFSKAMNYETLGGFVRKFQGANILPAAETAEVLATYAQIADIYPRLEQDMVSSHSDLKPENILFDGHRVWLVDWEAAFLNDRYFDLAVVANFAVTSDAEERTYLQEYFGQPPDEYQLARFFLMRQVMHMFYAAIFLLLGAEGKPVNRSARAPGFHDFHRRLWTGEVSLAGNEMKLVYGRVHWEQLSQNMQRGRFREALRLVSDRHASFPDTGRLLKSSPRH